MAFGQSAGPPAGQRQLDRLGELLAERGFDSFREARHRLGLTQRQANGRFTVDEADALIERLEAGAQVADGTLHVDTAGIDDADPGGGSIQITDAFRARARERRRAEHASALVDIPDDALADELVRRGWCCIPPPDTD